MEFVLYVECMDIRQITVPHREKGVKGVCYGCGLKGHPKHLCPKGGKGQPKGHPGKGRADEMTSGEQPVQPEEGSGETDATSTTAGDMYELVEGEENEEEEENDCDDLIQYHSKWSTVVDRKLRKPAVKFGHNCSCGGHCAESQPLDSLINGEDEQSEILELQGKWESENG